VQRSEQRIPTAWNAVDIGAVVQQRLHERDLYAGSCFHGDERFGCLSTGRVGGYIRVAHGRLDRQVSR
jgi:hypothetical protein